MPEYLQKIADGGSGPPVKSKENIAEIIEKAKKTALEILSEVLGEPWNGCDLTDFQLERLRFAECVQINRSEVADLQTWYSSALSKTTIQLY